MGKIHLRFGKNLLAVMISFLCCMSFSLAEPSISGDSPTPAYAERELELAQYKDALRSNGCQEINLDMCARLMYAKNKSRGFYDFSFTDVEKTKLSNYLTDEMIFKFGKTGKGLDIIYFKDENGKKTKEPALCYLGASDYNVSLKQVQKAIDNWEKDAPGFLCSMYANDVCIIYQNKANSQPGAMAKYEDGIIFFNCGKIDKKAAGSVDFTRGIQFVLGVELFGNRMQILGGEYFGEGGGVAGAAKELWGVKCCKYIYIITGNDFYLKRSQSYQTIADNYVRSSGTSRARIEDIMKIAEEKGLVAPYGATSWAEINSVLQEDNE
jgi:hypothetical protein